MTEREIKRRRRYSYEERQEAAELAAAVGSAEASRQLGISVNTLRNWLPGRRGAGDPFPARSHEAELADLAAVWDKLGHRPQQREYDRHKPPGGASVSTLRRHFGSFDAALDLLGRRPDDDAVPRGDPVVYEIRTKTTTNTGPVFSTRGRLEARSPVEALQLYLRDRPMLEKLGRITATARPNTAVVDVRTKRGLRQKTQLIAWPRRATTRRGGRPPR